MEYKIAEINLRLYGLIVDLMLAFLVPLIVFALFGIDVTQTKATFGQHVYSIICLVLLSSFSVLEGVTGQTPGKYFAETKVIGLNGQPTNLPCSIIRGVTRPVELFISLITILVMWFSSHNQRIGDKMTGTCVVYIGSDPEYDELNKLPTIQIKPPQQTPSNSTEITKKSSDD